MGEASGRSRFVVACRLLFPRTPNAPNWERNKYEYNNVGNRSTSHVRALQSFDMPGGSGRERPCTNLMVRRSREHCQPIHNLLEIAKRVALVERDRQMPVLLRADMPLGIHRLATHRAQRAPRGHDHRRIRAQLGALAKVKALELRS